jgi:hypothetical protein
MNVKLILTRKLDWNPKNQILTLFLLRVYFGAIVFINLFLSHNIFFNVKIVDSLALHIFLLHLIFVILFSDMFNEKKKNYNTKVCTVELSVYGLTLTKQNQNFRLHMSCS